eukprot:398500_1
MVFVIVFLLLFIKTHCLLPPTNVTTDNEYYITSVDHEFEDELIVCSRNCIIECHHFSACNRITIQAIDIMLVIINCSNNTSCNELQLTHNGGTNNDTNLQISCSERSACSNAKIFAEDLETVTIKCSQPGNMNASCYNSDFYFNFVSNATVYCMDSKSCDTVKFHGYDTDYVHIICGNQESCYHAIVECGALYSNQCQLSLTGSNEAFVIYNNQSLFA